jgi:hypothetical protein
MLISSAAISQAVNLCALNNQRFSQIGVRCFSQLETSGLLNQLNSPEDADDLFLSLIQTELEEDIDDSFERNQQAWAMAA